MLEFETERIDFILPPLSHRSRERFPVFWIRPPRNGSPRPDRKVEVPVQHDTSDARARQLKIMALALFIFARAIQDRRSRPRLVTDRKELSRGLHGVPESQAATAVC